MARPSLSGLILLLAFSFASGARSFPCFALAGPATREEVDPEVVAAKELAEQMLRVPSPSRRTEILDELVDYSRRHRETQPVLQQAIQDAWLLGCKRVGSRSVLRPFQPLVEARKELDQLRKETLALIRDEFEYPYPFKPPEASAEEVARYRRSQKKIDFRVDRMREIWRKTAKVRLTSTAAEALELAHWARLARGRIGKDCGLNIPLPRPEVPPWVMGLPQAGEVEGDMVSLASFGLSLREGKRLAYSRAVRLQNAELRSGDLKGVRQRAERQRIEDEFDQVRRTNDYRELLGLRALHISPELLEACRQHAEFLWELGDVSHEQPAAEFHTHNDRALRAGYPTKVWENCHLGSNQPYDVFEAWQASSEHHRVMVLEEVREIATARAGLAWVQNYGLDTGFQSAIQWGVWRD
ncbi:MAG: CAP domain-containing protein [Planctomycetota bacterium]